MKKLLIFFLIILSFKSFAQLGIKETNTAPNAKAMLNVESFNKGILIPRMNTAARDGITNPAGGLLIYNNQTKKFNHFDNFSTWKESTYTNQWNLNSGNISYSSGFVGINFSAPTRDLVINSTLSPDILLQQGASTGNTSTDGFMLGTNLAVEGEIWNFETGGIRFGTNNLERMKIQSNGNVGINTATNSKLGVGGNIKVSENLKLAAGEINRTSTGNANLIPIAYGNASASGGISGGSGNVTSVKLSTGVYELTIAGEVIDNYANYFYKVVPISANPLFATVYPFNPTFRVEIFNAGGLNLDGNFSFVVFKL